MSPPTIECSERHLRRLLYTCSAGALPMDEHEVHDAALVRHYLNRLSPSWWGSNAQEEDVHLTDSDGVVTHLRRDKLSRAWTVLGCIPAEPATGFHLAVLKTVLKISAVTQATGIRGSGSVSAIVTSTGAPPRAQYKVSQSGMPLKVQVQEARTAHRLPNGEIGILMDISIYLPANMMTGTPHLVFLEVWSRSVLHHAVPLILLPEGPNEMLQQLSSLLYNSRSIDTMGKETARLGLWLSYMSCLNGGAGAVGACPGLLFHPSARDEFRHQMHEQESMRGIGIGLLSYAISCGWVEVAASVFSALALSFHIDPRDIINGSCNRRSMPLMFDAMKSCKVAMVAQVLHWGEQFKDLISWTVRTGSAESTPLHVAAVADTSGAFVCAILQCFPESKIAWNTALDINGITPRELACFVGVKVELAGNCAATVEEVVGQKDVAGSLAQSSKSAQDMRGGAHGHRKPTRRPSRLSISSSDCSNEELPPVRDDASPTPAAVHRSDAPLNRSRANLGSLLAERSVSCRGVPANRMNSYLETITSGKALSQEEGKGEEGASLPSRMNDLLCELVTEEHKKVDQVAKEQEAANRAGVFRRLLCLAA